MKCLSTFALQAVLLCISSSINTMYVIFLKKCCIINSMHVVKVCLFLNYSSMNILTDFLKTLKILNITGDLPVSCTYYLGYVANMLSK